MLLGIPSSVNLSHNPDPASSSAYFGGYVQDDWKLARNFTVNLGLRYEFDVPRTERFNRLSYFDPEAPSPLAGVVPANPFFDPSQLKGAVVFVDDDEPAPGGHRLQQRQPTSRVRLELRRQDGGEGGYGMFYMPSHVQAAGHSGSAGMMGFNTQSDMIVSLDGRTPFRTIDNPFPDGFNLPPGELARRVHQPRPRHRRRHGRRVHDEPGAAHAAVERQRAARAAGQHHHGGGLHRQPRHRPADRRERAGVRPGRSVVPGPGHRPAGPGAEPVLRDHHQPVVAAALRRRSRATACCGRIRSTTASRRSACRAPSRSTTASRSRADKRFAKGLSLLASYTGGKLKDDASTTVGFLGQAGTQQNAYDRAGDYSLSSNDVRYRFVSAFVYDLPFGKNQRFGGAPSGVVGALISGWQVNGIVTFQSGYPLLFSQGANNVNLFNPIAAPELDRGRRTLNDQSRGDAILKWFDTSQFSVAPAFQFGNAPRVIRSCARTA